MPCFFVRYVVHVRRSSRFRRRYIYNNYRKHGRTDRRPQGPLLHSHVGTFGDVLITGWVVGTLGVACEASYRVCVMMREAASNTHQPLREVGETHPRNKSGGKADQKK